MSKYKTLFIFVSIFLSLLFFANSLAITISIPRVEEDVYIYEIKDDNNYCYVNIIIIIIMNIKLF